MTYGVRNMQITFLPKVVTSFIGSFILCAMGLFIVVQGTTNLRHVQDVPLQSTVNKNSSPRTLHFYSQSWYYCANYKRPYLS